VVNDGRGGRVREVLKELGGDEITERVSQWKRRWFDVRASILSRQREDVRSRRKARSLNSGRQNIGRDPGCQELPMTTFEFSL
jgi:hypothetical protein